MRSRSRSPRRRHSRSRSRDRRTSGKTTSRPLRRSRSKSPQKSSKRKSDIRRSRSDSVKRRRSDAPLHMKDQKKREVQKQEADSTDSPQKLGPEKRRGKSDATKTDLKTKTPSYRVHESAKDGKKSEKSDVHKPKQPQNVTKQQQMDKTIEGSESERPFDQTEIILDDRFSALASKTKPFVPDENVTIEIERIVAGRAVPFAIPPFWSDAVQITRRADEGKKPLADREEFLRRRDDSDDERRVVKVHRNVPENFDIRRDKVPEKKGHASARELGDSKDKSGRQKDGRAQGEERDHGRHGDKSDTRNFTDKLGIVVSTRTRGADGSARPVQRSVMTAAAAATTGRQFLLPAAATMAGDLRKTLQDRESARIGSTGSFMPGFRSGPVINQPNPVPQLPDFAHRPDKYAYEEWKDRPELIPKGRSYYEHDDREAAANDQWNSRFGGRGFGRGGMGRGGRGARRSSFDRPPPRRGPPGRFQPREDSWKHDKFEEVAQPTSN